MKPNIHVELTSTKKNNIKNICKKATTQQPCLQYTMKENYNFKHWICLWFHFYARIPYVRSAAVITK